MRPSLRMERRADSRPSGRANGDSEERQSRKETGGSEKSGEGRWYARLAGMRERKVSL